MQQIEASNGGKVIKYPTEADTTPMFGIAFEKTKIDQILLSGELEYTLQDEGIAGPHGPRVRSLSGSTRHGSGRPRCPFSSPISGK